MTDQEFDVIVVGGGTSGAVVAARLSQDPARRVLLLEAGQTFPSVEAFPPQLLGTDENAWVGPDHNWWYARVADPGPARPGAGPPRPGDRRLRLGERRHPPARRARGLLGLGRRAVGVAGRAPLLPQVGARPGLRRRSRPTATGAGHGRPGQPRRLHGALHRLRLGVGVGRASRVQGPEQPGGGGSGTDAAQLLPAASGSTRRSPTFFRLSTAPTCGCAATAPCTGCWWTAGGRGRRGDDRVRPPDPSARGRRRALRGRAGYPLRAATVRNRVGRRPCGSSAWMCSPTFPASGRGCAITRPCTCRIEPAPMTSSLRPGRPGAIKRCCC